MEGVPRWFCFMIFHLAQGELLIAFRKNNFLSASYVSPEIKKGKEKAWACLDDITYDNTQSYMVDGTVPIKKKKNLH